MNVKSLKELLANYPDDMEIAVWNIDSECYNSIIYINEEHIKWYKQPSGNTIGWLNSRAEDKSLVLCL